MAVEIKEILDNIKNKYEAYYVQDIVSGYDLKQLLDCITNLQNTINELVTQKKIMILKNKELQQRIVNANKFIDNYDVFKEFTFPLMKRDVEQQIKSSIDYEFNNTFRTKLKDILNVGDKEC